jgi:opacity protein-like surface antigen
MKFEGSAFDPLRSPTLQAISPDVLERAKIGDWYGMLTGRLGYAWDRTLVYVKGGAALVQINGRQGRTRRGSRRCRSAMTERYFVMRRIYAHP